MGLKRFFFIIVCIVFFLGAKGQNTFVEGRITYKLKLEAEGKIIFEGKFNFAFKGSQIRKEIDMAGYQEVILINTATKSVYSLRNVHNKMYAIQLLISDLENEQAKYDGYKLKELESGSKTIAGIIADRGEITYPNGDKMKIYYTRDWSLSSPIVYERFPDAKFIPLIYSYKSPEGINTHFELEELRPSTIENSLFSIPSDYKLITNEEYKLMK